MTTEQMEKSFKEIRDLFKETDARLDKQFKETDARLDKRFKATEKITKETSESVRKLELSIERLERLFTSEWGKLIESLAESGIVQVFQKRGIAITELGSRMKSQKNGRNMEVDFLLFNSKEIVVGEVKTTLKVRDVKDFLVELDEFPAFFPRYKGSHTYGAIVGIRIEEEADKFAYRNGLFVLTVGGEGMLKMLNDKKFQPTDFSMMNAQQG
jgi:single-stranded DNA-specific DHH superfamily exonuclease